MAKGLRSKTKRAFRTAKRGTVAEAPAVLDAERKRQEIMDGILEQGRAKQQARDAERVLEAAAAPAEMDAADLAAGSEGMELDKRLKVQKKLGKGKRITKVKLGISGANQFHRMDKTKKSKRRKNKNNPGYTIATSY